MPVFCQIRTVIVKDEQLTLTGSETVCFDEHYHAFKIVLKPFQGVKVVDVQELSLLQTSGCSNGVWINRFLSLYSSILPSNVALTSVFIVEGRISNKNSLNINI